MSILNRAIEKIKNIGSHSQEVLEGDSLPNLEAAEASLEESKIEGSVMSQQLAMSKNFLESELGKDVSVVHNAMNHVDRRDELRINTVEGQMDFSNKIVDKSWVNEVDVNEPIEGPEIER